MARRRKSLLKKHEVQVAVRRRTCKNSGDVITKGESCLVVWDAQFDSHPYSRTVALQMISDARVTLDRLENALGTSL
jgi:hypothetical protein